jgi:serine/threonine protein phosphatase PrpC
MEVSKSSYRSLGSWKKRGLLLDIHEINRTFQHKKQKLSEISIQDTLIDEDRYGICSRKGRHRKDMEDAYDAVLELDNSALRHAFAIFDGHSGPDASLFASKNLIRNIESFDEKGIIEAFQLTDCLFCIDNPSRGGTTVALVVIDGEFLKAANLGDSKIILVRTEGFEVLSYDHIASDISEKARIELAGGYVICHHNTDRVCGQFAITRSIGDARFKEFLIPIPNIQVTKMKAEDLALVIASDGLFEKMTPQQVSDIVREKKEHKPAMIAETLTVEAIEAGSKDNVSVMVVKLQGFFTLTGSQTDRNKKKTFKF